MKYFDNYKTVNLDMLRESGIYSESILKLIEEGKYRELSKEETISKEQSQDIEFMGPIVYAFKQEHKTYAAYEACAESLQKNIDFAIDIIREEPEVIENTEVGKDREFIEQVAPQVPEVVKHMSQNLKEDSTFIEELCELNNSDVTKYAAQECKMPDTIEANPELANDKEFMLICIENDPSSLEYASEELKEDYEFIKVACDNEEVIDYVVENTDEFGQQGLMAAKDVVVEKSSDEAISRFKEKKKEIEQQISGKSENDSELETLIKKDKQLQRHIKFFERIQNGEIDPVRAAKLIDKMCANLDDRYREQIKKVLKLDEAIAEKQKETEEKTNEQINPKITVQDIERTTEDAKLPGVEGETVATREGIEAERAGNSQQTKEGIEIND